MSKSPRRLIGRAAGALAELAELEAKHPEISVELETALGADVVARLSEAPVTLEACAAALEHHADPTSGPPNS